MKKYESDGLVNNNFVKKCRFKPLSIPYYGADLFSNNLSERQT